MLLGTATVPDLDRLTARVFDTANRSCTRLEAYRDGDTFYIDIELPGADPARIDISTDHETLTIRAERRPEQSEGLRLVVGERRTGAFSRELVLSQTLDTDRIEARCDDGVLTLRIPVTEAKPRRAETSAAAEDLAAA